MIKIKQSVARPLAKIVVDTWKPVMRATVTVAGNMTITCWIAYSRSFPVVGRSCGR